MSDYCIADKEFLENGLKIIGDSIRAKTGSTEEMEFPLGLKEQVDSIEEAFWGEEMVLTYMSNRSELTSCDFPEGIKSLVNHLFFNATKLVLSTLPDTIENIGESCFQGCEALGLNALPRNLKVIGYASFRSAGIFITDLPLGLETIGDLAFLNRTGVKISVIPATVKKIGNRSFEGTGITSVTFRGTLNSIGTGIFNNCNKLLVINVPWSETDPINANAPWGASNATINYNYVETEE